MYNHPNFTGIEFSDEVMQVAVSVTKKLDNFINDCDNYVAGRFKAGEIDENLLFIVNYINLVLIAYNIFIFLILLRINIRFLL